MNRGEFTRAVFERLTIPITGARLAFGVAWAAYESTDAKNNPWATTLTTKNSTEFNRDGVKNYPTFQDGVDATVLTLLNTDYSNLLRVLRDVGSTMREIRGALNASPWGSKVSEQLWLYVLSNYDKENIEVPGSGTGVVAPSATSSSITNVVPVITTPATVPDIKEETPVVDENGVDTLESRITAQEEVDKVTEAAVVASEPAQPPTTEPNTTAPTTDVKAKVVGMVEDFLAHLKENL